MRRSGHPLSSLRWTTRGEVCAELLRYSEAPGQDPLTELFLRPRVAELFALLAEEEHIPVLQQLHLDSHANYHVRQTCYDTLVRLEARVPVDELKALLEKKREDGRRCNFGLFEGLFRTPEAQNAARQVMESWTAAERAWTLTRIGWHDSLRGLADWLYERWLDEDRCQLEDVEDVEGPLNRTVAWYTAKWMNMKRPESKLILLDYWRRAEGEQRRELQDRLWDFDEGVPAAWVADRPEELRELAESFTLPHADLVSYYGEERLLQIADEKLRDISRQLRAHPDDDSSIETTEFKRMVAMLADWPEPGAG